MIDRDSKTVDYIKSFRGLPKKVNRLEINFPRNTSYPGLDIEANCCHFNVCCFNNRNEINIKKINKNFFRIKSELLACNSDVYVDDNVKFKNRVNCFGFNMVRIQNDELSKKLIKIIDSHAPLNKNNYLLLDKPIDYEIYDDIEKFFIENCNINIDNLSKIVFSDYKKNSGLWKDGDQWYKINKVNEI